ncbi:zinc finger BED domain-containing protein 5-like [Hyperolius riggenbachi]|uniref:zinc finger BED domain-containing protein 5-like n=1 Tax=Hyperolius riggenbachi TaxID=752182 RepID=UPI0035A2B610
MERFLNFNRKHGNGDKDCEPQTSGGKGVKRRKCRKYDDSYLNFGFTSVEIHQEERPQCVICLKVLAPECMIPSKLKRHLETNHPNVANKSPDFFARRLSDIQEQKKTFLKQASIPKNALLASYKVAYLVAKCKKPHTIAEDLILPAAMEMVTLMAGESTGKLLSKIPLSNSTVSRRIECMAEDLNDQITEKMKGKEFGLQLDEATDSHKDAHLICYARFIDEDKIMEDLLFCKSITAGIKGQDLFNILDTFMSDNNLDWTKCVGVCTDGGRSMSGCYVGLQALGKNTHILKLSEKISAFKKKLILWRRKLEENDWKDCFPLMHDFITSNDLSLDHELKCVFEYHLTQLSYWFEKYFPEDCNKYAWVQDPFRNEIPSDFTSAEQESFIELSCDINLKAKFSHMDLTDFWITIANEYPLLSAKAKRILIPFATSYLCEAGFSAVAVIKSKYRSKLEVEKEMRLAVSNLIPRFEKLCSAQQAHTSH